MVIYYSECDFCGYYGFNTNITVKYRSCSGIMVIFYKRQFNGH